MHISDGGNRLSSPGLALIRSGDCLGLVVLEKCVPPFESLPGCRSVQNSSSALFVKFPDTWPCKPSGHSLEWLAANI